MGPGATDPPAKFSKLPLFSVELEATGVPAKKQRLSRLCLVLQPELDEMMLPAFLGVVELFVLVQFADQQKLHYWQIPPAK